MSFVGLIQVRSPRTLQVASASFSTTAARDSWLDADADLSSLMPGLTNDGPFEVACFADKVQVGYTQLAVDSTTLYALDRTQRSVRPIAGILVGQSNARGTDPTGAPTPTNPNSIYLFGNDYVFHIPATEPIDTNANQVDVVSSDASAGVGPSLACADSIQAARNRPVIIIPAPLGATDTTQWQRPSGLATLRSTLFGSALYRAWEVRQRIGDVEFFVIWYQGENNATTAPLAAEFQADTQAIFDAFHQNLGTTVPIFCVKLPPTVPPGTFPGWADVRTAQDNLHNPSGYVHTVAAPDGPFYNVGSTNLHLSGAAQVTLGHDIASAWLAAY